MPVEWTMGVKLLILHVVLRVQTLVVAVGAIETLGNVLDGDFVVERDVVADVNQVEVDAAGLEHVAQRVKGLVVGGVAVDKYQRTLHAGSPSGVSWGGDKV
jgi:hypothetical protein